MKVIQGHREHQLPRSVPSALMPLSLLHSSLIDILPQCVCNDDVRYNVHYLLIRMNQYWLCITDFVNRFLARSVIDDLFSLLNVQTPITLYLHNTLNSMFIYRDAYINIL